VKQYVERKKSLHDAMVERNLVIKGAAACFSHADADVTPHQSLATLKVIQGSNANEQGASIFYQMEQTPKRQMG
jgi:hypothetical protein